MRHRIRRPILVVLVLGLVAVVTTVVGQSMGEPHARPEYGDWLRLNPQRNFITSAHPSAKDVYVNPIGADAVLARSFPVPAGTEVVKESTNLDDLSVFVLTAMRKVPGFDPANGDWQYGMFERVDDGSFGGTWADVDSDMHGMCVSCHVGAASNDYLFLSYTGD